MRYNMTLPGILICVIALPVLAAPSLSVVPLGAQAGKLVWQINITPDVSLVPDSSGTPVAFELGFRLTGDPLISVTNINPSQFDTNNPGKKIFGWETTFPSEGNLPAGIEVKATGCTIDNPTGGDAATVVPGTTNEIFVAMGSVNFITGGPKPFLKVVAAGPDSGVFSSTIQWLGAYGTGGQNGRIAQISGMNGSAYIVSSFDTFSGSLTQTLPEPASAGLIAIGAAAVLGSRRRRRVEFK